MHRRYSLVVELQLPKLAVRVRFPLPAPKTVSFIRGLPFFPLTIEKYAKLWYDKKEKWELFTPT